MQSWCAAGVMGAALVVGGSFASGAEPPLKPPSRPGGLKLSSTDVHAGKRFPEPFVASTFGCTGGNRSPELQWSRVPAGTKSFAITMFDPDEHGTPSGWWHWVVYDIPATADHLPQNAGVDKSTTLPAGSSQGRNDEGDMAYAGPCPDAGDPPHRYVVTLYALKVDKLPVPAGASGANVTFTAHDYTLGTARLIARHDRSPPSPGHP
jgi:Raf kinase inhibitor-like YbhB/YbcL family protein